MLRENNGSLSRSFQALEERRLRSLSSDQSPEGQQQESREKDNQGQAKADEDQQQATEGLEREAEDGNSSPGFEMDMSSDSND